MATRSQMVSLEVTVRPVYTEPLENEGVVACAVYLMLFGSPLAYAQSSRRVWLPSVRVEVILKKYVVVDPLGTAPANVLVAKGVALPLSDCGEERIVAQFAGM